MNTRKALIYPKFYQWLDGLEVKDFVAQYDKDYVYILRKSEHPGEIWLRIFSVLWKHEFHLSIFCWSADPNP